MRDGAPGEPRGQGLGLRPHPLQQGVVEGIPGGGLWRPDEQHHPLAVRALEVAVLEALHGRQGPTARRARQRGQVQRGGRVVAHQVHHEGTLMAFLPLEPGLHALDERLELFNGQVEEAKAAHVIQLRVRAVFHLAHQRGRQRAHPGREGIREAPQGRGVVPLQHDGQVVDVVQPGAQDAGRHHAGSGGGQQLLHLAAQVSVERHRQGHAHDGQQRRGGQDDTAVADQPAHEGARELVPRGAPASIVMPVHPAPISSPSRGNGGRADGDSPRSPARPTAPGGRAPATGHPGGTGVRHDAFGCPAGPGHEVSK